MAKGKLEMVCPKGDITQGGLDIPNKGILCGVDWLKWGWRSCKKPAEEELRYHPQWILGTKSSMAMALKLLQTHSRKSPYFELCHKQRAPESGMQLFQSDVISAPSLCAALCSQRQLVGGHRGSGRVCLWRERWPHLSFFLLSQVQAGGRIEL